MIQPISLNSHFLTGGEYYTLASGPFKGEQVARMELDSELNAYRVFARDAKTYERATSYSQALHYVMSYAYSFSAKRLTANEYI